LLQIPIDAKQITFPLVLFAALALGLVGDFPDTGDASIDLLLFMLLTCSKAMFNGRP